MGNKLIAGLLNGPRTRVHPDDNQRIGRIRSQGGMNRSLRNEVGITLFNIPLFICLPSVTLTADDIDKLVCVMVDMLLVGRTKFMDRLV